MGSWRACGTVREHAAVGGMLVGWLGCGGKLCRRGWFPAFALFGGAVHQVVAGCGGGLFLQDFEDAACLVDGGAEGLLDVGTTVGDAVVVEVVKDVEVDSQI